MSAGSVARAAFRAPTHTAETPRVLVLFAHPAIARSRVNRALAEAARAVPHVTVHDLYEAYPDAWIDVAREQALLAAHDAIVFQHPFYWYSSPALLKEWQDQVLTFGWAYGKGGTALRGKRLLSAVSTGGTADAYTAEGLHGTTVDALLAPFRQTARLCGMTYLPPFVTYGTNRLAPDAIVAAQERYARALADLAAAPVSA